MAAEKWIRELINKPGLPESDQLGWSSQWEDQITPKTSKNNDETLWFWMEAAVIAVVAMVASVFPPQKEGVKELLKVSRPQV